MQILKFFYRDVKAQKTYIWLWKSKVTMNIEVFGWHLLPDRLNTKNMLKRRHYNIGDDHVCVLCGQPIEETIEHMTFDCQFSAQCLLKLGITWAGRYQDCNG